MLERSNKDAQGLALLYNATTLITVTFGVVVLYVGLFVVAMVAQLVIIDSGVLRDELGRAVDWSDRLRLSWMAASLATVAGAVGTGIESDEAVHDAAYGYRQRERTRRRIGKADDDS
jgi:hypothetical protein